MPLVPNWERSPSAWILSPFLFNLYAEYLMQNAGLDESQAVIKTVRGYADDTTNGREQRGTKEPLDEGEKDQ